MPPNDNGTFGSTPGPLATTWSGLSFRARLLGFALVMTSVAVLIARFDTNIWQAQEHLREGFAAIKAEKFYFGVNFRVSLRKMTADLLDFHLTGNAEDLQAYRHDAEQLKQWLKSKEQIFVAPGERRAFTNLESAYARFVVQVEQLQNSGSLPPPGDQGFAAAYARIRQTAQGVLRACDEVVDAEHAEFDVFVRNSDDALTSLQRLFLVSLVLLMGLALILAVLVYRGMIAPLRARLTESRSIIERQEKLASLGALGAGVAHEIRNPLTAIKFRLFSLKKALPSEFRTNEDARVISEEINRLDRIVKDFLQFARPSEPELVPVPAERILRAVHDLMKPELEPSAIELKLDIQQPAWIQADTAQLKQVLINLVQNSADSIQRQGKVTLRLSRLTTPLPGGARPAAILAVADNGKGIPPGVQKRLFDPFFTTKEGGTGLGLAIAARIVEKHGGLLRYTTELSRGTVFEIALPESEEHAKSHS